MYLVKYLLKILFDGSMQQARQSARCLGTKTGDGIQPTQSFLRVSAVL